MEGSALKCNPLREGSILKCTPLHPWGCGKDWSNWCVCVLLLQDLLQSCARGGRRRGTREEPGTLTQGAPVFPGFLSFGNRTQSSRVAGARPNHQPIGGSDPNHQGIWRVISVVFTVLFVCLFLRSPSRVPYPYRTPSACAKSCADNLQRNFGSRRSN